MPGTPCPSSRSTAERCRANCTRPRCTAWALPPVGTDRRLAGFDPDAPGVAASFADHTGAEVETQRGAAMVGADGIHSTVREALVPGEGPLRWNGTMLCAARSTGRRF
jgi:2-polyprenyl-6-methoxyphenol hydroxylase-like FAD-dependent oxidoreductase